MVVVPSFWYEEDDERRPSSIVESYALDDKTSEPQLEKFNADEHMAM